MQTHFVKGYVLLLLCVPLSGCIEYGREGKFVSHGIDCKKATDGDWTLARKGVYNRFNVVHETRYQVSFAAQRVVSDTGSAFKNCRVYDRGNWQCDDVDGSSIVASGGKMQGTSCSKIFNSCSLEVNRLDRIMILVGDIEAAERLCKNHSKEFDMEKILGQYR